MYVEGNHTKLSYNERKHREAATLCQLRAGWSRLNYSFEKIGATDSEHANAMEE
jgi:hypothetical protein